MLAYLSVPAQEGLRQGLFVQGRIGLGSVQAVAVPLSALRSDKPRPYLQLLHDGKIAHLNVLPGALGQVADEDMVAIEGLAPGTIVLRAGTGAIAEGTPARAAAKPPTAAAQR